MLEIQDIDGLFVLDTKFNRIFGKEYSLVPLDKSILKQQIQSNPNSSIFLSQDHLVLVRSINDLYFIFYASTFSNEVFLNSMFNLYLDCLKLLLKKPGIQSDHLESKFDYLVLLTEYFIYDGMFMIESTDEALKLIPKRTFEDLKGMPVPKGFSSIFKKVKFFK